MIPPPPDQPIPRPGPRPIPRPGPAPAAYQPLRKAGSLVRRSRRPGPAAFPLFARTFVLLLAARLALQLFPVARVIAWKQRSLRGKLPDERQAALARARIRHAILVVARYSPVRFVCFPQCLAAAALLRAQGLPSRLHYGVTRKAGKLATHTWLESGDEIVIGGEAAGAYSTLAVY